MRLLALRIRPCRRISGANRYATLTPWVPPPMRELDLQKSYSDTLRRLVDDNYSLLKELYDNSGSSVDVEQNLVRDFSPQYSQVRKERVNAPKKLMPTATYNEFLRRLYPNFGGTSRVDVTMQLVRNSFPSPYIQYIQGEHLEELLAQAMMFRKGAPYLSLFESLIQNKMPVTAREKAKYLQILAATLPTGNRWRQLFMEWRSEFDETTDIATLNTLLSMAGHAKSKSLTTYVEHQKVLRDIPDDRFTYQVRMKYADTSALAQKEFENFRTNLFTVDGRTMHMLMKCFLRHNQSEEALALLTKLEDLTPNVHITVGNEKKNANVLKAIDRISQLTGRAHHVPMGAEFSMYQMFFDHFAQRGDVTKAIDIMVRMADQGHFVKRHKLFDLAKIASEMEKHRMLVFLKSVDLTRSEYLSDSLLKYLTT